MEECFHSDLVEIQAHLKINNLHLTYVDKTIYQSLIHRRLLSKNKLTYHSKGRHKNLVVSHPENLHLPVRSYVKPF